MSIANLLEAFRDRASRLTLKDIKRLQQAFVVAQQRGRIPSGELIVSEMKRKAVLAMATYRDGGNPTDVFESSVKDAFDLIKQLISEAHGDDYASELWARVWSDDE
jgi:hypothetical protein